jgi:hypothetical protein
MAALPALFSAFDRNKEFKLPVIPGLGSSGVMRALADGALPSPTPNSIEEISWLN